MAGRFRAEAKVILVFFALLALVAVQVKLMPYFAIGDIKPDLFLLLVSYLSLRGGEIKGTIMGFSLGLLEDSFSLSPLGFKAFGFSLVGFLLGYARRGLLLDSFWTRTLLLSGAGLISGLASLLVLNFFLIPRPLGQTFLRVISLESLFTALWGVLILSVFGRWRYPQVR
jgi:rod shape-determining protein MreD